MTRQGVYQTERNKEYIAPDTVSTHN